MLVFHAVGDWDESQVRVESAASSRPVVAEVERRIDEAWARALARPGVLLFDGPMCRLESWDASPQRLSLTLSRTSYRAFLGTNLEHPDLPERYPEHGRRILANPVGVSPALLTADGFLLLGRRNASVAYYPDRIHPFAGALEPGDVAGATLAPGASAGAGPASRELRASSSPAASASVLPAGAGSSSLKPQASSLSPTGIFAAVRRELQEELAFTPADIAPDGIRCTGIAEDLSIRQPELVLRVCSTRTRAAIEATLDRKEHRGSWAVRAVRDDIEAVLKSQLASPGAADRLTPVAVASLMLWGRVEFGSQWFESWRNR